MRPRPAAPAVLVALAVVVVLALSAQSAPKEVPGGVPVRYAEGMVHGFLELRTADGTLAANGDLLQVPDKGGIESRMIFRFPDSSLFSETVSFTQHRVFALRSYHLVQQGPAFTDDLDASLSADGHYLVKARRHRDGHEEQYDGTLTLPADVSNGLVMTLLKNLRGPDTQTVHVVAFTPKPRLVSLALAPTRKRPVFNGRWEETAVEFVLKPRLGGVTGVAARFLGKMPPDSHVWIVVHEVPAFMRFEGPLYDGPIWRIDLGRPRWPKAGGR